MIITSLLNTASDLIKCEKVKGKKTFKPLIALINGMEKVILSFLIITVHDWAFKKFGGSFVRNALYDSLKVH
jgi:hypothetical protein